MEIVMSVGASLTTLVIVWAVRKLVAELHKLRHSIETFNKFAAYQSSANGGKSMYDVIERNTKATEISTKTLNDHVVVSDRKLDDIVLAMNLYKSKDE